MPAKTLMIQGSSSSAGKSWLVTALCRLYARRGVRVAPFKAQNMSNNAAVCADGGEIGRAQALQALAAGIAPTVDMNPILLKPEGNGRSQVIVRGRIWNRFSAREYYQRKEELWPIVTESLDRLRAEYELVLMEGAGSPAELNLRSFDLVNMSVARYARAPVLLVGDIDRGGIFAQLLGTLWLLNCDERAIVCGLVVNKFRGDSSLFDEGVRILEDKGEIPVLGVVPFLAGAVLPEEDSVWLDSASQKDEANTIDIAVIRLPHIANFDDFDALRTEPGVRVRFVDSIETLGQPHAVIVPGTKSTIQDLIWLRERGLFQEIRRRAQQGLSVVGICGGYQILGQTIQDPQQVEAEVRKIDGLALLPVYTTFESRKSTRQVHARVLEGPGWLSELSGVIVQGFEIHMGQTQTPSPWLATDEGTLQPQVDGAIDSSGRIWGCYLHGLFANDAFRRVWLASIARQGRPSINGQVSSYSSALEETLDRLAQTVEQALDMNQLDAIIEGAPYA